MLAERVSVPCFPTLTPPACGCVVAVSRLGSCCVFRPFEIVPISLYFSSLAYWCRSGVPWGVASWLLVSFRGTVGCSQLGSGVVPGYRGV